MCAFFESGKRANAVSEDCSKQPLCRNIFFFFFFFFLMCCVNPAIKNFYESIYFKAAVIFFQTVMWNVACFSKKNKISPPSNLFKKSAAKISKKFENHFKLSVTPWLKRQ